MAPHTPPTLGPPRQAVARLDPAIRSRALSDRARSPLATWLPDGAAVTRFRGRLGGKPIALPPRDVEWRRLAPGWRGALALARAGVPFHLVSDRRYDRSANRRRLRPALDLGVTAYLPQAHEVLPRVARLMVAIRAGLLGPFREECSFLFIVKGRGREGMGLHHDGRVDAFWLQLDGRRTVTLGPPVRPGTAEDLPNALADRGGPGWRTIDLTPGTLFYLPPFTPHRVLCHGRSLALSLTWSAPSRRTGVRARPRRLARRLAGGLRPGHPDSLGEPRSPLDPDPNRARAGCLLHEALDTGRPHPPAAIGARAGQTARHHAELPPHHAPRLASRGHRHASSPRHPRPPRPAAGDRPRGPRRPGRLALPLRPRYVPVRTRDHHTTGEPTHGVHHCSRIRRPRGHGRADVQEPRVEIRRARRGLRRAPGAA